jgi:hypothetical protein
LPSALPTRPLTALDYPPSTPGCGDSYLNYTDERRASAARGSFARPTASAC